MYDDIKEVAKQTIISQLFNTQYNKTHQNVKHLGHDNIIRLTFTIFCIASDRPICINNTHIIISKATSYIIH